MAKKAPVESVESTYDEALIWTIFAHAAIAGSSTEEEFGVKETVEFSVELADAMVEKYKERFVDEDEDEDENED